MTEFDGTLPDPQKDLVPPNKDGFIDKRSTFVRDLVFSLGSLIFMSVSISLNSWLNDNQDSIRELIKTLPPAWAAILGVVLSLSIAALTNFTKRYGRNKS